MWAYVNNKYFYLYKEGNTSGPSISYVHKIHHSLSGFPTLKGSWPWPWIGSYCIPSCITHRPLPMYQISLKSKKLFVDRRMYGPLRLALLGQLWRVDLINMPLYFLTTTPIFLRGFFFTLFVRMESGKNNLKFHYLTAWWHHNCMTLQCSVY